MAKIEITVEPNNASEEGWFVHLFSWNVSRRDVIVHRLRLTAGQEGDDKFVLESEADLPPGTYRVMLHLLEVGNKASATVTGEPQIEFPFGVNWPMTVEAEFHQDSKIWAFRH